MNTCKFCEFTWTENHPCERGMDYETGEVYYCGFQACPMCGACQGRNDISPESIRSAKHIRAIREGHSS